MIIRLLGLVLFTCISVEAQIAKVCPTVAPWPPHFLYKYQASGHFSSSDIRRNSCSLIIGKGGTAPVSDTIPIYDKSGTGLNTFRVYARGGDTYAARFYTYGKPCSSMASEAKTRTTRYYGYLEISPGVCIRIRRLTNRQGGV